MNWIKEMMELQDQSGDAKEFVENVKEDILAEEIYVFTPDGTVRSLPKDSGPIDLPMKSTPRLGKKRLVLRSMAGWCPSILNFGREIRWRLSPMPTPLVRAVTG